MKPFARTLVHTWTLWAVSMVSAVQAAPTPGDVTPWVALGPAGDWPFAAAWSAWLTPWSRGDGTARSRPTSAWPAGLMVRGGAGLSVSPDLGRSWVDVPFGCGPDSATTVGAVAVDAQRPGHVVLAGGLADGPGFHAASGCPGESSQCGQRPIAFHYDVSAEAKMAIAMAAATTGAPPVETRNQLDRAAAGWGYASIAHLATARPDHTCVLWDVLADKPVGGGMTRALPDKACASDTTRFCHARKAITANDRWQAGPSQRDHWCKSMAPGNSCQCTDDTTDCRYPGGDPSLAIDPRNGFAYLSTNVGLLTSRDGGARWERVGTCDGTSALQACDGRPGPLPAEASDAWPFPDDPTRPQPAGRAARLLTMQDAAMTPAVCDDAHATDLNVSPQRIAQVGQIQWTFETCDHIPGFTHLGGATYPATTWEAGQGPGAAGAPARRVGRLVASVTVQWQGPDGKPRAGLFVASEDDCATLAATGIAPTPGPLVFRDTASTFRPTSPW